MTQYNTINKQISNSQLNKLKSGIKNGTDVTLNLSSNVVDDFTNEINFTSKLLWTNTQVSYIFKAFENDSSANINFSKAQLSKIVQLGRFLPNPLGVLNLLPPFNMINSTDTYIKKELKDTNTKEINSNHLVDTGINTTGKKN